MSYHSSTRNSPIPAENVQEKTQESIVKEVNEPNGTVEELENYDDLSPESSDKMNGIPRRTESLSTEYFHSTPGTDKGLSIEHGLETVYVQKKNGSYKPTSTNDLMFSRKQDHYMEKNGCSARSALDMAIIFQKLWYCLSNFCFGILAGVAALHLIIMFSTLPVSREDPESNLRTVQIYSNTAFILPMVFYVCLAICLISLFDRFDTSQLENDDLKDTFSYKFCWLVIVLYLLIFLLHSLSAKYDDLFVLYDHDDSFTYQPQLLLGHLELWRWLDGSKCVLCVLGWFLVSLVPSKDFLLHHLKYLKTYDLDSLSPTP